MIFTLVIAAHMECAVIGDVTVPWGYLNVNTRTMPAGEVTEHLATWAWACYNIYGMGAKRP